MSTYSASHKIPSELSPPPSEAPFKFLAGAGSDSEPGHPLPDINTEASSRRWNSSFKTFGGALVLVSITISLIFVFSFTTFSTSIDHSVEEVPATPRQPSANPLTPLGLCSPVRALRSSMWWI